MTVRACLITNPRARSGSLDLSEALAVLHAQGWEVAVRQKLHGDHATELGREAAHDGYDVVVCCGGDGTLSEIVDGVTGTNVAVGVLPGGTVNLWARELGIAPRLRVAAMQLVGSERRHVDVGHVTINGRHGRHFLLMAGLGLDGAVMAHVSRPLKQRFGRLAIGIAALQAAPSHRSVPVRVEIDGVHWHGRIAQIVVGNTRRYAGFTTITADAYIDDGLLDICLMTDAGPTGAGRQLISLLTRRRPDQASAETYRAATVTIRAPVLLPLQIDGGAVRLKGEQPTAEGMIYRFSVIAQGVTMLVPRTYSGTLFEHRHAWTAGDGAQMPVAASGSLDGQGKHRPKGKEGRRQKGDKSTRKLMTVLAVGVDTLTVVHGGSGHVDTVLLGAQTTVVDQAGAERPWREALDELREGQAIRIKGKQERDDGTIVAHQVVVVSSTGLSSDEALDGEHNAPDEDAITARGAGEEPSRRGE